jgi:thiosulfate/3-mercaptopyruvate sulfurtransferase
LGEEVFVTPLVSTAWLAENFGAPDICVLDASFYMPADKVDPHAVFVAGHIPGARFFDIETIADVESALPHMVPSVGRFEKLVRALGVSNSNRIIFYDQKGIFSAPRGWWMMRLFGHDRVAVLDGGLPKWRADGRAIEEGVPGEAMPGDFRADFRSARLRGIGDMLDNLVAKRELVLDARAAGRFAGSAPEPRPGLPSGHIPGAASVPASELLRPDQTYLDAEALRARFAAAGVTDGVSVVTSCGTGVSAAVLTLGLEVAGLRSGALYDGSWTEWAARDDTPKEIS